MTPPTGKAGSSEAVKQEDTTELATISVSTRVPEFWKEQPRLWFVQFEAIVSPQKQGDEYKYQLAVSKLGRDALQQVSDIVFTPPATEKYKALKDRLLKVYEESPERQFQRLVGEMELGSQKPSQLLRKMKDLARNCQADEETVRRLWLARQPASVRAVLTVSQDQTLENLATIADKIVENMAGSSEVASVSDSVSAQMFTVNEIMASVNKLALEVAALRGEMQSRPRRFEERDRSTSRTRPMSRNRSTTPTRTPGSPDWMCRFHFRYGPRARRCEEPCAWKKPSGN